MGAVKGDTRWTRITVRAPAEAEAGIADVLLSFSHGIEEKARGHEMQLIAYLPAHADTAQALARIEGRLAALREAGLQVEPLKIVTHRVRSRRWEEAWKAGLGIVHIPPRVVIKPTWKPYDPAPGEVVIELDPGMAFGTGQHATTKGCLEALGRHLRGGEAVFDIGAGSGILSIAAAKLGAGRVVAIEVDESAAQIAAQNVALNDVANVVAIICGDGLGCIRGRADVIVANLTAPQIIALAPEVVARLRPGGLFIASGIAAAQGPMVREAAKGALTLREAQEQDDWVTIVWEAGKDAPPAD